FHVTGVQTCALPILAALADANDFFHYPRREYSHAEAKQVQSHQGDSLEVQSEHAFVGYDQRDENGEHRQTGGTTHQRRNKNGNGSLFPIVDGTCGHDGGDRASYARDQGHDAFAIESELPHDFVHEEHHARHVPGFFQYGNKSKQYGYLWNEDDDTSDARYDTLCYQVRERSCGKYLL